MSVPRRGTTVAVACVAALGVAMASSAAVAALTSVGDAPGRSLGVMAVVVPIANTVGITDAAAVDEPRTTDTAADPEPSVSPAPDPLTVPAPQAGVVVVSDEGVMADSGSAPTPDADDGRDTGRETTRRDDANAPERETSRRTGANVRDRGASARDDSRAESRRHDAHDARDRDRSSSRRGGD